MDYSTPNARFQLSCQLMKLTLVQDINTEWSIKLLVADFSIKIEVEVKKMTNKNTEKVDKDLNKFMNDFHDKHKSLMDKLAKM